MPPTEDVTALLRKVGEGDPCASEKLFSLLEAELRSLAAGYLRNERPGHTLQATALVNEAFLRMVGKQPVAWQSRSHFFGVAAKAIRRVLIDHARKRDAQKRGGRNTPATLHDEHAITPDGQLDLVALDDALSRLAELDERQARVVELRFFAGLTVAETAETLGVSDRTVEGDWSMARAWLKRELASGDEDE